jgi:hypothetical protein
MSLIGLNQIAGSIANDKEFTFSEILEKLNDTSAFQSSKDQKSEFEKDVKILSTINKIKTASIGTVM